MTKPKKQTELVFQNVCNCIVDYELLSKAMLWYSDDTIFSVHKIYMHGIYPAVSINESKIHVHRLLLLYLNRNLVIGSLVGHHINHNKLDCTESNLQLLSSKIHASHHNKGKTLSAEHRAKISERNRLNKGIRRSYKVEIPIDELRALLLSSMSINKIAKHFNCDWSTIKFRIHDNPELLK